MILKITFCLVLLLIVTSFSFQNYAEAREATEPCSYLSKYSYIKITAKPLNCKKVDYHVPEECGKIAGLYLTDSRCQPPAPIPTPIPEASATSVASQDIPNPINNGGQHYYQGVNDLHTPSQQVNCGEGTVLRNNVCIIKNTSDTTNASGSNDIESVVGLVLIIGTLSALIAWRFGKRGFFNRNRIQQNTIRPVDPRLRVTPAELDRIREFERSYNTIGKSDPEYFLHIKSGAKLIDASRRGNELYDINTIIRGRTLKILKYRDPSTGQVYISFVPEEIDKADDGMAWKFSLDGDEYDGMENEA